MTKSGINYLEDFNCSRGLIEFRLMIELELMTVSIKPFRTHGTYMECVRTDIEVRLQVYTTVFFLSVEQNGLNTIFLQAI
jgi:hypothetical protein